MNRKILIHIRQILMVTLLASLLISCNKEFLDVPVQSKETAANDPQLASLLLIGAYNSLLEGDPFGNGDVHGFAFISATNIMSDDADKGSYALDQANTIGELDDFTITTTNQFCNTLWLGHYNGIGATNQALKAYSTSTLDKATLAELRGEVRFIRAFYFFDLVRMFGGVPLVTHVPVDVEEANSNPIYKVRAPVSVVYDTIVADLQYAIKQLPIKSAAAVGHATKGAAEAMLAKVYMYQNNWPMVRAWSDSVIASGQYQLVPDYASQFRQAGENGPESIFEIETGSFNNANFGIANYTISQGPREGGAGGWNDMGYGFNDPSTSLINSYESGDLRKAGTIIFIDNSGAHKGTVLWDGFRIPSSDSVQNLYYNYKTYTSTTKETFSAVSDKDRPQNVIILRYADVLLMNAEAGVQLGMDAATPLNQVRARAGLAAKGSPTMADIKQERHVELAMEDDRFWDLVRWGDVGAAMAAAGKTNFAVGRNELLPIPSVQIQLTSGGLTQNPGY